MEVSWERKGDQNETQRLIWSQTGGVAKEGVESVSSLSPRCKPHSLQKPFPPCQACVE